mgnify:CR=1 FL=1
MRREVEIEEADRTEVGDVGRRSRGVRDQVGCAGDEPGDDDRHDREGHHDPRQRHDEDETQQGLPPAIAGPAKHLLVHPRNGQAAR